MAYCNDTDVRSAIPATLIEQIMSDALVAQDVIDEACESASAVIDSYLQERYLIPIRNSNNQVPLLIKNIATFLAMYSLYTRNLILDVPESLSRERDIQLKTLEKLSKGAMTLDAITVSVQAVDSGIVVISKPSMFK